MLKNFSMKNKLVLMVIFFSLILAGVGFVGLFNLNKTNASFESVYQENIAALTIIEEISMMQSNNQTLIAETVADQLSSFPSDLAVVDKNIAQIRASIEQINTLWEKFLKQKINDEGKKLVENFTKARMAFGGKALLPAIAGLSGRDFQRSGEVLQNEMKETYPPLYQATTDIIEWQKKLVKNKYEESQKNFNIAKNISFALILSGIALSVLFGMFIIRSTITSLNKAIKLTSEAASGNLAAGYNISPNNKTEVGQLIKEIVAMNEGLSKIITNVRMSANTMADATQEIAQGTQDLSTRTERQAASLEETASAIEELTGTVGLNAANAANAAEMSIIATSSANAVGEIVFSVVKSMEEIKNSSTKISEIVTVIDNIAFQTNILALNAAVEAARAGESGRGFAVVASEVRTLAANSAKAAKEIKLLIENTNAQIAKGGELVHSAGESVKDVITKIDGVKTMMTEIAVASEEQKTGINQINMAVLDMDSTTQNNAALVEEAAAAAESLAEQAEQLIESVSVFQVKEPNEFYN